MGSLIARWTAAIDRWWDRLAGSASAPDEESFTWRRHVLTIVAITGFVGLNAARRTLDSALQKVHPVDSPGYGANDLHSGRSIANSALRAWESGSAEFDVFLRWTGQHIAVLQTCIELALVPFSATFLYAIVRFLRNELRRVREAMDGSTDPALQWRTKPHEAVLTLCTIAIVAYLALGVFNQLVELAILARNRADNVAAIALQIGFGIRRPALLLVILPIITTSIVLARREWHPVARIARAGSAYRVLGILALLHFVMLLTSVPAEQSRDAIRLWPERGWLAVWGVGATACFSIALAALGIRLSTLRRPGGEILKTGPTFVLSAVGAVLALAGLALHSWARWGNGVTALGVLLAAVGVFSLPILAIVGDGLTGRQRALPSPQTQVVVPAVLATAPLIALEIAIVQAGTSELVTTRRAWWLLFIGGIAAALAVLAFVATRWVGERAFRAARDSAHRPGRRRAFTAVIGVLFSASLAGAVFVIVDPWDHGRTIGVHGLLGSFLVLATAIIGSIGYAIEGRPLPASLDFLGVRRIPIVTALIAWGLIGNALHDAPYHEIRVMEQQSRDVVRSITVIDAFDRWVHSNAPESQVVEAGGGSTRDVPGVPMIFVTAAGGGLRAAAFTATALECLFTDIDPTACTGDDEFAEPDSWSRVFVASGASGGSVGIASVVAQRATRTEDDENWIARRLGTDLLSAELAWQLFVEAPNALGTFNPGLERAEVLERSWERRFGDEFTGPAAGPYLARGANVGAEPLLFLNGTNLPDGCRVNISSGRTTAAGAASDIAPPGSTTFGDCRRRRVDGPTRTLDQVVARDLVDYMCSDEDIRLSTAAFLSSRFPFVAPTGIVRDLLERRPTCSTASETGELAIGDGGYRDNTGAAAVADVWSELEPIVSQFNQQRDVCVVPFLVEIDNGHRNRRAASPPAPAIQVVAPLQGALGVFASRDAGPIEALASDFSRPLDPAVNVQIDGQDNGARFVRFSPYEHPGVLAPLGWSLSTAAVQDLQNQLDQVDENRDAVRTVGSWLEPGSLSCTIDTSGRASGESQSLRSTGVSGPESNPDGLAREAHAGTTDLTAPNLGVERMLHATDRPPDPQRAAVERPVLPMAITSKTRGRCRGEHHLPAACPCKPAKGPRSPPCRSQPRTVTGCTTRHF